MKATLRLIFALTGLALSVGLASVRHTDGSYDYGDSCAAEGWNDPGVQACNGTAVDCIATCLSDGYDSDYCGSYCDLAYCDSLWSDATSACDTARQEDCDTTCGRDCSGSGGCEDDGYADGGTGDYYFGECDYYCN